jgi:outer membrane protein assembly factor BamE (lipoprotein component of BamABCDE complex)
LQWLRGHHYPGMLLKRDALNMKLLRNAAIAVTLSASVVAGCQGPGEVLHQGYVVDQARTGPALARFAVGDRDLRQRGLLLHFAEALAPGRLHEAEDHRAKRCSAVYFDKDGVVERLAHYTLKDGKRVFDMISRVTPTGGNELTFLGQLLRGTGGNAPGAAIQNLASIPAARSKHRPT